MRAVLAERLEWLRRFVDEQAVQTNEIQRVWGLLPAFLSLGERPLDLLELGSSGGLNLLWDRYRYRYGRERWGPVGAPLELRGDVRRPFPPELLDVHPSVVRRRGIDLDPVDVGTEEGARLLECFLWPDQAERRERLRKAIEVARDDPPEVIAGDYVELLPRLLEERMEDALPVVFQTASLVYLTPERYDAVYRSLDEGSHAGPLAWVTYENDFVLELRVWPGLQKGLARMDFHGAWLEWLL